MPYKQLPHKLQRQLCRCRAQYNYLNTMAGDNRRAAQEEENKQPYVAKKRTLYPNRNAVGDYASLGGNCMGQPYPGGMVYWPELNGLIVSL